MSGISKRNSFSSMINDYRPAFVYAFCFLLSIIFLLIATKSSPLYPFNDWVDANASFTMGKAMMNGRVLYRDIFNQKGPLLYLIYGLAYLISNTTFIGVFVFEVVSFSVFLFFSYKLISLYLDIEYGLISLPILAAVILNLKSFTHGGSPEELCLPLVTIGLYHLFVYFRDISPKAMPYKWVLINGFFAGCILWVKFSLLGFWFGWVLSVLINLIINKDFLRAIKTSLVFLSGMLLATLPWIGYFGVNNSIPEWINSYFVINLTGYSTTTSLLTTIRSTLFGILASLRYNPVGFGLLYFGMIVFLIFNKFMSNLMEKISLLLCFTFLAMSVFGGGRLFIYYFFIFSPFLVFGLIVILNIFFEKFGQIHLEKTFLIILMILFVVTISYTLAFHYNTYMLKIKKEDLVQYEYASIINQTQDPTLLNYGVLDLGFYTTTGIIPNVRFFQSQNIPYSKFPLVVDEQNRYLKEGIVDYVVIQSLQYFSETEDIPYLNQNYELIKSDKQRNEETEFFYLLFKKKNN